MPKIGVSRTGPKFSVTRHGKPDGSVKAKDKCLFAELWFSNNALDSAMHKFVETSYAIRHWRPNLDFG